MHRVSRATCVLLLLACSPSATSVPESGRSPAITATSAAAPPAPRPSLDRDARSGFDLVLDATGPGAWSGANGNLHGTVRSIWGAGGHVFVSTADAVLHSEDRGLHWSAIPEIAGAEVWGASIDELYANGPRLLRSVDRGATWSLVRSPSAHVERFWARAPGDIFATGYGVGDQGDGVVFHTQDRASTWTEVHPKIDPKLHYAQLFSITGAGANELWIGGEAREAESNPPGNHAVAVLVHSGDGGKTWSQAAAPPLAITGRNEGIRALCVSASGTIFGNNEYVVFMSPTPPTEKSWTRVAGADGSAVACAGHQLLSGGRGSMLRRSRDDGATWTTIDLGAFLKSPPRSFMPAAFITDTGEIYLGGVDSDYGHEGTLVRGAP